VSGKKSVEIDSATQESRGGDMIESTYNTKGMLEGILSEAGDMRDGLGDMFQFVVNMAMQSCLEMDSHAGQALTPPMPGGLASWQLRRAQALMTEALGDQLSVTDVARECGLSYSHFRKAFRRSVGVSPHRWLCSHRVERAKWLLINTDQTLLEVASACGFCEQCHFTRTFSRMVGMAPGVWRQAFGADSPLWSNVGVSQVSGASWPAEFSKAPNDAFETTVG
jgi:AraC family transcriptional regulator